ncbi:hypothetical protein CALCODRAFT_513940 [Calocera cornea HHB12733]|uniref:Uncharacterized protein n=1 Tax=Calocera cornea HHB12733 TaxID=1353952 RepID=A0A165K4X0_9BASI|nr:hypothetical protein CALCODRAFT_513940 [Calocera cornea HHB12733]
MALTPSRPPAPWQASSPDPLMFPTPAKRPAHPAPEPEQQQPASKRRRLTLEREPESDASTSTSTRTTPSMIVAGSQMAHDADAPSDLSDTPMTPTPLKDTFYVSEVPLEPPEEKPPPPLPDALLLLMIPQLVLEPPSSPNYVAALYVSWLAMRRCLRMDLTPEVELRALTGQAEVALLVLDAAVEEPWVKGVADVAENGITRGLQIVKQHPTLAYYASPLSFLQVRLAVLRGPTKRALNLSRQTHAEYSQPNSTSDASWLHYLHHSHVLSTLAPSQITPQLGHLATPPRVDPLFTRIHSVLRLTYLLLHQPEDFPAECRSLLSSFSDPSALQASDASLLLITQVLSLLHSSSSPATSDSCAFHSKLLDSLPALLDDILSASPPPAPKASKTVPILFPSPPKKLLLSLACLVAAAASRDASGRQSKRGIWAAEGLKLFEEEMDELPRWYSLKEKKALEKQLHEVRALLLCELISVAIMRSEFQEAKKHLDSLELYTSSVDLFTQFSPIISLLHGRLAHSVFSVSRAKDCYFLASHLAKEQDDTGIRLSATLDLLGLKLGLGEDVQVDSEDLLLKLVDCNDENLNEPARVFRAIAAKEIHKSKQHLKFALDSATLRQDNYLRLLVLSITASHYQLTKASRAVSALQACRQLCLSLGAPPEGEKKPTSTYGNASIGLWVGEKYAELLQRQGKDKQAKKQEGINHALRERWTRDQEEMARLFAVQQEEITA